MKLATLGKNLFNRLVKLKDILINGFDIFLGAVSGSILSLLLAPFVYIYFFYELVQRQKGWDKLSMAVGSIFLMISLIPMAILFVPIMIAQGAEVGLTEGLRGVVSIFKMSFKDYSTLSLCELVDKNDSFGLYERLTQSEPLNPFEKLRKRASAAETALEKEATYLFSIILRHSTGDYFQKNLQYLSQLLIDKEETKPGSLVYFLKNKLKDDKVRRDALLHAILKDCPKEKYDYYLREVSKIVQTSFFAWHREEQWDLFIKSANDPISFLLKSAVFFEQCLQKNEESAKYYKQYVSFFNIKELLVILKSKEKSKTYEDTISKVNHCYYIYDSLVQLNLLKLNRLLIDSQEGKNLNLKTWFKTHAEFCENYTVLKNLAKTLKKEEKLDPEFKSFAEFKINKANIKESVNSFLNAQLLSEKTGEKNKDAKIHTFNKREKEQEEILEVKVEIPKDQKEQSEQNNLNHGNGQFYFKQKQVKSGFANLISRLGICHTQIIEASQTAFNQFVDSARKCPEELVKILRSQHSSKVRQNSQK